MRLCRQPLEVVDEAVTRVLGVLVVHADVDRFFGAHFLAVAAEDAAELVDLVDQRIAVALFILARHELDAVRGTDLRAESARDAFRPALLVGEHAMGAAPAGGERPVLGRFLLGILHRDLGASEQHVLEVLKCNGESGDDSGQIKSFAPVQSRSWNGDGSHF